MYSWETSYLYCNRNQNRQRPVLKTMYICGFTQVNKVGLHPEMLLSFAYIIKLLEIKMKMKIGLLTYAYFFLYVYSHYLRSHKMVFWYSFDFLSEFSRLTLLYLWCYSKKFLRLPFVWICYFWLLECRVLARTSNSHHNLGYLLK